MNRTPATFRGAATLGLCALVAGCSTPPSFMSIQPAASSSRTVGVVDASTPQPGLTESVYANTMGVTRPAPVIAGVNPNDFNFDAQYLRDTRDAQYVRNSVPLNANPQFSASNSDLASIGIRSNPTHDSRAAVVGLYGEMVSGSRTADAPADGSSNLAQVSFATEGACFDPTIDSTGRRVAFASTMHQSTSDIYMKSRDGRTHTQLTTDPSDDVMPSFSPDGSRIAFASNRQGSWDIFVMNVDRGAPVQVTSNADHELHPTWSPDGRKIAFCRYGSMSGVWEIWVVDLDNPGKKQFLEYGMFPQWNPDLAQSKILFQRARQRGSRYHSVWTVDYVNNEAVRPTEIVSAANAAAINPTWSPDGRRIAFVTVVEPETQPGGHPNQSDVWIVNADGTNRTNLTIA
ncbi:MAG: hypothetical protein AAF432_12970 [Planctomycetota bacterium]